MRREDLTPDISASAVVIDPTLTQSAATRIFDALEDAGVPTVMMFVQSLHGISHNKIEDTKEEHLELAVTAFDKLADKAMRWIG